MTIIVDYQRLTMNLRKMAMLRCFDGKIKELNSVNEGLTGKFQMFCFLMMYFFLLGILMPGYSLQYPMMIIVVALYIFPAI